MTILPQNFYVFPRFATTTLKNEDLESLLLHTEGWVLACGYTWNIRTQPLTENISKVWLERETYES